MDTPPQAQRSKVSFALILLVLFVLAAGGGVAYLSLSKSTPSWLSMLIPSSRYAPSQKEAEAARQAPAEEETVPAQAQTVRKNISPQTALPAPSPLAAPSADSARPVPPPTEAPVAAAPAPSLPAPATQPEAPSVLPSAADTPEPPVPGSEPGQAPQPPEAAAESRPTLEKQPGAREEPRNGSSHPVIIYGKARPAEPGSSVMRGHIPPGQAPAEYAVPDETTPLPARSPARAHSNEDSVVPLAFIQDLARFLASNFWPAGTHPMARDKAISTASVKWVNVKYGSQLQGFNLNQSQPDKARARLLNYAFTPSMLNGLYALYSQRFLEALDSEARVQLRGEGNQAFDRMQLAGMYELYSGMAHALAEAVRAYMRTPDVRIMVGAYSTASLEAAEAYRTFSASLQQASGGDLASARKYQEAIVYREQKREELASAMRRHGAVRELDADSLVYVAQWLYRRGTGQEETFNAFASVLDACAAKMNAMGGRYRTEQLPPVKAAETPQ